MSDALVDEPVSAVPSPLDTVLSGLGPCTPAMPRSTEQAFEAGNDWKRQGRYSDAVACFRESIELTPHHQGAYNNLANTLRRSVGLPLCGGSACPKATLHDAAVLALRTVVRLNPSHANAYTNLGSLARTAHQFEEAIQLGRLATRIQPRHTMAYENLGRALQADSAPQELPSSPGDGGVDVAESLYRHSASGGWRRQDRLEDAVDAFRSVLTIAGPRSSRDAYRGLGYSLLWLGREHESRQVFQSALAAGVWSTSMQYPGELDHSLRSSPFPSTERVSCLVRVIEEHGALMEREASDLLVRSEELRRQAGGNWSQGLFSPEREGLHTPMDGFAFYDVVEECATAPGRERTPSTCAVLDWIQSKTRAQLALMRISRLQVGVTISAHTGLRNSRWRLHFPLKLPGPRRLSGGAAPAVGAPVPTLRVGPMSTTWTPGKAFVFDDSYEHDVTWTPSAQAVDLSAEAARLSLIVDFQHPDLSPVC